MAHLSLSCLGPFQAALDGRPVTGFKSNKVRALLSYLMVEEERPHRRDVLAGLLWPEWPDREALGNLRYSLSNLRRVIGDHSSTPPYLSITRATLQFNGKSDSRLDVKAFLAGTEPVLSREQHFPILSELEEAIDLYRGCFLEGFSISDSSAFEEWIRIKRQQIDQQLLLSLRYLALAKEESGHYEQALVWARRQIELDPWDERTHQQLMRLLALAGQRSAALVQFDTCRHLLKNELGVEPARETTALYDQIRSDSLTTAGQPAVGPPGLTDKMPAYLVDKTRQVEMPVFVSRDQELGQLKSYLDLAMGGSGRVAFVTGEAGSGKTALMQEFSLWSQELEEELCVASGNCEAYTGIGDPYLPFREILAMLSGDVEAKLAAGAISGEHARRLWQSLPLAAEQMIDSGQGLINTFVPGIALRERVSSHPQWPGQVRVLNQLEQLIERKAARGSRSRGYQQSYLFEQYTRLLQALAGDRPLLLLVDDLQWADLGSISLLFHLGRHLAGYRILIVGAYRPEEINLGRDGERHPLEPVINELQLLHGDVQVNIDQSKGSDFVHALLDNEPNQLSLAFRNKLTQQTRGHPLFTVELLRGMQERGDLILNPEGCWVEGPALDWETLPARVEAAIAERIGRLPQPQLTALQVASVEGEEFTAEVVAGVVGSDEREIVNCLSSELDRMHRLVRPRIIDRLGTRRVSRYRFRNYLFQKYLYENLDRVERAYLHEDVGTALERLYGDQVSKIDVQLARHFQEAGITEKAVEYLRQAGENALQLSAYQEATTHLTKGLDLLMVLPDSIGRGEQELALQFALGIAGQGTTSARSLEVLTSYKRARELCIQTGKTAQLCEVMGQLAIYHYVGAEYLEARKLAREAFVLAQNVNDPLLTMLCHWYLGIISFALGEHLTARAHFNEVISIYNPGLHHHPFIFHGGKDAGLSSLAYDACCLWCLGYPDQASERSQQALNLARELAHSFSLADVICFAGCNYSELCRDAVALKANAEELIRLGKEEVAGWQGAGTCFQGEALAMLGQYQEGIKLMQTSLTFDHSKGIVCYTSRTSSMIALAQARAGRIAEGMETMAETFRLVEDTEERYLEPELHRMRAEMLLMQGHEAGAEASLLKAVEVARRQSASSWELRATTSLARLWIGQGKREEALQALTNIYEWFNEGFDSPDLIAAKGLLNSLA